MSSSLLLAKRRLALLCTASRRVDPWCWHTVAGAMDCYEALNEQQVDLAQQLKALVAPLVQKYPELQLFCNDWTYVRYLRARHWDLHKAHKMLAATLQWRLEYRPHDISWSEVQQEALTGKTFVSPHTDKEGRPVVIMTPRNENTKNEEGQVRFLIYCLEHASRLADEKRVGKMMWLIDFEGYSLRNAPAVRTSVGVLHILQNHYPERLGGAVCYHAPSLFSMTWKAVSPFIDPITKKKIAFVDKGPKESAEMSARFELSTLERSLGGNLKSPLFDLETYGQRMKVEDAAVASALRLVEVRSSSGSMGSNLSDASTCTRYGADTPMMM